MAVYSIRQSNDYDRFVRTWSTRYTIYKKCWYGWSYQAQTNDINEVQKMVENLIKEGDVVFKHWTLTQDI